MPHPQSTTDVPESLWLCVDQDLLDVDSSLDDSRGGGMWPRVSKNGVEIHSWKRYRKAGMNELDRRLRSRKDTAERFEMGRLSLRSRDSLRIAAVYLALHYLYVDADQSNDDKLARKAAYYWDRAADVINAECTAGLDYDSDRSGTFTDDEKQQPMPCRVIRG